MISPEMYRDSAVDRVSVAPTVETPVPVESEGEIGDLVKELLATEAGFSAAAKDGVWSFMKAMREMGGEVLPDATKAALFGILLMGSETAIAAEIVGEPADSTEIEQAFENSAAHEMSPELRRQLGEIIQAGTRIRLVKQSGDRQDIQINSVADLEAVTGFEIDSSSWIEFVTADDNYDPLNDTRNWEGWEERELDAGSYIGSKTAVDESGARVEVYRKIGKFYGSDQFRFMQTVIVHPEIVFALPGASAETQLSADLTDFGLGKLENLATYQGFEAIADLDGTYVYTDGQYEGEYTELLEPYTNSIAAGIRHSTELFGLQPDIVKEIFVQDSIERNAAALISDTAPVLIFNDELFKASAGSKIGDPEYGLLSIQIQQVAEHETFHAVDGFIGLSKDKGWQEAFYVLSSEYLKSVSESNRGGIGGHAQDNPYEFTASLLNVIDCKDEAWITETQRMTDEEIVLFKYALSAMRGALNNNPAVGEDAPVKRLVNDRLDYMLTLSTKYDQVSP
ncbi:MAG: hypothetical protein WAZ14_03370 [Patescibacteria group bacterium]